jgi:hypothetical protein
VARSRNVRARRSSRCENIARAADEICEAADRICRIAANLDEPDAHRSCARSRTDCDGARAQAQACSD